MREKFSKKIAGVAIGVALLSAAVGSTAMADSYRSNETLIIYFTRHAEKQTVTTVLDGVTPPTYGFNYSVDPAVPVLQAYTDDDGISEGDRLDEVCGDEKCAEELSDKGTMRAMLLADWFAARKITNRLDAVYATHKTRTQQTVTPTAMVAGLEVINVLDGGTELAPQSTSPSECATLQAIEDSRMAEHDTIVIAGHSGTLYDIMGSGVGSLDKPCVLKSGVISTGLGLDTGNTVPDTGNLKRFPKSSSGKVANFGDIWKVVIGRNGSARFFYRQLLTFKKLSVAEFVR